MIKPGINPADVVNLLEQRREQTRALKHAMMQKFLTGRTQLLKAQA